LTGGIPLSGYHAQRAPATTATAIAIIAMKDKPEYKPPWFTLQVIGIAGPSASGKTSVAKALVKRLNVPTPPSSRWKGLTVWSSGSLGGVDFDGLFLQAFDGRGVETGV
jgi:Phosphoribulokinase / Uridine kinase family